MKQIRDRDRNRCRVCGVGRNLHVHHIKFRSQGGPDEPWNLITLCQPCHDRAHGLDRERRRFFKWELHALVQDKHMHMPSCLTCEYRLVADCAVWDEPTVWDYVCNVWKLRQSE